VAATSKLDRALTHVAGYTCFIDGSVRDYQKFSVTSGKNFPAPVRSALDGDGG